jgi:hypothetical protein
MSMFWAMPAQRRGEREPDRAEHEHPSPAEPVAQRTAEQDERRQGERVAVQRPLQAAEVGAEIVADARQRDVDHRRVEEGHAGAEHGGEQDPAAGGLSEADLDGGRRGHDAQTRRRPPREHCPGGRRRQANGSGQRRASRASSAPTIRYDDRGDAPVDQDVLTRVVLREQVVERLGQEPAYVEDEVDDLVVRVRLDQHEDDPEDDDAGDDAGDGLDDAARRSVPRAGNHGEPPDSPDPRGSLSVRVVPDSGCRPNAALSLPNCTQRAHSVPASYEARSKSTYEQEGS